MILFLVFLKSLLDASALSIMVTAYGDKLERVLSLGIALTPSGFLPRLQGIEAIQLAFIFRCQINRVFFRWFLLLVRLDI